MLPFFKEFYLKYIFRVKISKLLFFMRKPVKVDTLPLKKEPLQEATNLCELNFYTTKTPAQ